MSADSPRRAGVHKGAQVVTPQPVSDKSIIDSVAGIINDIVPQAYSSSSPNSDNREAITWARFEYADVNDSAFYPDYNEGSSIPPLLLVLGYTTGVQVWLIAASGEATEVLSWRQGMVRTLRILPSPKFNERERDDQYKLKRPLVAICDSAGPGPQFCSVSFISLKTGEQVKSIKFKSPVCDVLANKRSIVVTFPERIAVFDAKTLEDVLTITTCYLSPGPNPNPVALGTRWLAYSEKKLIPGRRSSGGSEGEGVASYTATVLYAAKSLGKGLRGLGETVASSLTGNSVSPVSSLNNSNSTDMTQPGVVTILDLQAAKEEKETDDASVETVIAHFTAHNDAIVAMTFDQTGALLMTADKRGHDFHVFRIQPHPGGPSLAAVHHLYVLHRGDTTAKVQDMTFSSDARWAAISTVRGTTHVFPVAPYGGAIGVRTHSSPHVVNRLSRFHKSAGLTDDGARSHSPVSHAELPLSVYPYTNPRLPPYPHPTILHPLAQIRQPSSLNHSTSQAQPRVQQRQRLLSDDSVTLPLKICACFAPPRAWIYAQRDSANKLTKRAADSLFVMACHGNMIQYDLEPKPVAGVPKEKVCDETSIELEVEAKGQWPLLRTTSSSDIVPPLPPTSPLLCTSIAPANDQQTNNNESRWLSQVEIFTHAGPHRRLWMGPQFVFKTYNAPSGVAANLVEAETVEVGIASGSRPARSNPVNMPHAASRPLVPVVIDGSGSSYEQSPRFVEAYGDALDHDSIGVIGSGENQLREDLAEAMLETSSTPHRVAGRRMLIDTSRGVGSHPVVAKVVNPLGTVITISADEQDDVSPGASSCCQQQEGDDSDNIDDIGNSEGFKSSEDAALPPPSICAEEGSCTLSANDKEPSLTCESLREHTEICAEMRSANEPAAIDSVPDENIEDIKERRSLCAEAASATSCCTVDLDRVGAFKDVPSSAMLCAERGAVPDCSNVVQAAPRLKPVLPPPAPPAAVPAPTASCEVEKDSKNSLSTELGYQLVETQERVAVVVPEEMINKATVPLTCGTSSDDDLEHINKDELPQPVSVALSAMLTTTTPTTTSVSVASNKKQLARVLSSDDDLEHVLHCDVAVEREKKSPPPPPNGNGNGRKRCKEKQKSPEIELPPPVLIVATPVLLKETKASKEMEKPVEQETQQQQQQQQQPSYSKKTRVRSKRPSIPSASNDMIEIINMDVVVNEPTPDPITPLSLPLSPSIIAPEPFPEFVPLEEKFDEPTDMVEIIDIDAEKSSGCFPATPVPDLKILMPRPEIGKKKSKRRKNQQQQPMRAPPPVQVHQTLLDECMDQVDELHCEAVEKEVIEKEPEEVQQQTTNSSWSSILRRRSGSSPKVEEPEPKPLIEVESLEDDEEANKENVDITKKEEHEKDKEFTAGLKVEILPCKKDEIEEAADKIASKKQEQIVDEEIEKKSDSDQETPNVLGERSSSSDDLNANSANNVIPMDTEEESSNGVTKEELQPQLVSALSEKNGSDAASTLTAALLPKKTTRSKKKKRR